MDWNLAKTCISESLKLRQATAGIELLKSEEWAALKEGICTNFYVGNSQEGETCIRDWDCQLGSWCSSETPTEAGTRVCIKERNAGQSCSDHAPCSPRFFCDQGLCIDPMTDNPQPIPELGSACVPEEEMCGMIGNCIGCRPATAVTAATLTCEILGSEGDYCELKGHCAPDLGCTNHLCSQVGVDEMCMTTMDGPTQNMCDGDSLCVDECWQYDMDEVSCSAATGCVFDLGMGYCDSETLAGICVSKPGIGDDCLLGIYCADGFCNPDTTKCSPFANADESCIPNPENLQSNCLMGYFCLNGVCSSVCQFNEDCGDGEYCDGGSESAPPACQPIVEGQCKMDMECAENQYCDRCELQDYNQPECNMDMDCTWFVDITECQHECGSLTEQETCSGNTNCNWDVDFEMCASACLSTSTEDCATMNGCSVATNPICRNAVDCWNFMDAESCNAGGCLFDEAGEYCTESCSQYTTSGGCEALSACTWEENQYCSPAVDCIDFTSSDTACNAQESCAWFEAGFCGPANPQTTFECAEKNAIGSPCRGDSMCDEGGICMYDENEEPRCHYPIPDTDPSCNYTSVEFLRGTFLLGIVFAFRRRRRRQA